MTTHRTADGTGLESLDEQMAAVLERRDNCLDLLVQMIVAIDGCSQRLEVLLDRRIEQAQQR